MTQRISEYELVAVPIPENTLKPCKDCMFHAPVHTGELYFSDGTACLISHIRNLDRKKWLTQIHNDTTGKFMADMPIGSYGYNPLSEFSCEGIASTVALAHKVSGVHIAPEEIVRYYQDEPKI